MYLVPVEVKNSLIHGKGVFATADIPKDTVVWKFKKDHDQRLSVEAYEDLGHDEKKLAQKTAYLSPQSDMWVIPPPDDPACFTNHSKNANLSVVFDKKLSSEPIFIAKEDIAAGDEITNDYREFDKNADDEQSDWLKD